MFPPGPAFDRDEIGTSFAAPKVARIAAQLQRLMPEEPALLYRGLVVHSARWPDWAEALLTQLNNQTAHAPSTQSGVPNSSAPNTIGILPWWTYISGQVPGVGAYSSNIANGNFITQAIDMNVAHRDVGLNFTRTYNSESTHDTLHTDGSSPSRYGNGWTSNIDMRLAVNSSGGISFFDATGARWDYASNGSGGWTAPPGQRAQLIYGGSAKYYLTMPNRTTYYFWSPFTSDIGSSANAYLGLLNAIIGREHNNYVSFNYYFDNNDTSNKNFLNRIAEISEDGTTATYSFTTTNGFKELTSLTRPDGSIVQYTYNDQAYSNNPGNNLWLVQVPGNNIRASLPRVYQYTAGSYLMKGIQDPRSVTNFPNEGGEIAIGYDGSNRVTSITNFGVLNFSPLDGTGMYLQPSLPTGYTNNGADIFTYATQASGNQAGLTQYQDSNGHQAQYFFDTMGRLSAQDKIDGTTIWRKYVSWTANNYLSAETDFANSNNNANYNNNTSNNDYDARGNLIASAGPQVTASGNLFRPTKIFAYDSFNNLIASCDENWVHSHGQDWGAGYQSGVSTCPQQTGTSIYYWGTAPYEPYGRLNGTQTPTGYLTTIGYLYGSQDIGKPVISSGTSFSQVDGSTMQPSTKYGYDSAGDLTSVTTPQGTSSYSYDAMGRLTLTADADNVQTASKYYNDGSLAQAYPSGRTYSYDAAGNLTTEVTYFNTRANIINHWYDAYGRLVETQQPYQNGDAYAFPWMERNLYDLSKGNSVSIVDTVKNTSTGYFAHGELYKTQRYLSSPTWTILPSGGSPFWMDTKGTAYDSLDRPTASYFFPPNSSLSHSTDSYDQVTGRLATVINGVSDQQNFTYDALGRPTQLTFVNQFSDFSYPTPNRNYSYDADGHVIAMGTPWFGTQSYAYNADGNLTDMQEAAGSSAPISSPAHLTYHYYPNGTPAGLDVQSSALTQTALKQYTYRNDGLLQSRYANYSGASYQFRNTYTKAGRLLSASDPFNTNAVTVNYSTQRPEWLTSYSIPEGTYSNIAHDQEGQITGLTLNDGSSLSMTFSARNELTSESINSTAFYAAVVPTDVWSLKDAWLL